MMPLPEPDEDRQPGVPTDDLRPDVSRPYPGDNKGALEQAFQDAVNGVNLRFSQRFFQGKSFIFGASAKMFRMFPEDAELHKDLREIRAETLAIKAPHPTLSYSIDNGARVLQFRESRPDASVDSIQESLAPGFAPRMEERDYAGVLESLLEPVWELATLMEQRGLMHWEMEDDDHMDDEDFEVG